LTGQACIKVFAEWDIAETDRLGEIMQRKVEAIEASALEKRAAASAKVADEFGRVERHYQASKSE
jgi:hypothetical protein